jgi:hypothetical protein
MIKKIVLIVIVMFAKNDVKSFEKDSTFLLKSTSFNKEKMMLTSCAEFAIAASADIGVWNFWYKKQKITHLHSFDDSREWGGMDKLGHSFTANKITGFSTQLAYWSGCKPWKARAYGFGVAFVYQTSLELMDGISKDWGFSWTDILANTSGSGLYILQDWAWKEQRIRLKFSYSPTTYAQFRPNTLGKSFSEQLFKDYNGQSYWLSANISSFISKENRFPKWINLAIGHSMDQKLFGFENQAQFVKDGKTLTFSAQHQWYMSLDIDFKRIPTQRKWLKNIFNVLNLVKIPFPALRLQHGKLGFSATSY